MTESKEALERPQQTEDEYFLAEAECPGRGGETVVILYYQAHYGVITDKGVFDPLDLVLTGRKYRLVLDQGHPEWLETEQDHKDAPEGTIITMDDAGVPWIKTAGCWSDGKGTLRIDKMACVRCRVLRWGGRNDD